MPEAIGFEGYWTVTPPLDTNTKDLLKKMHMMKRCELKKKPPTGECRWVYQDGNEKGNVTMACRILADPSGKYNWKGVAAMGSKDNKDDDDEDFHFSDALLDKLMEIEPSYLDFFNFLEWLVYLIQEKWWKKECTPWFCDAYWKRRSRGLRGR